MVEKTKIKIGDICIYNNEASILNGKTVKVGKLFYENCFVVKFYKNEIIEDDKVVDWLHENSIPLHLISDEGMAVETKNLIFKNEQKRIFSIDDPYGEEDWEE